ncbi:MAG: Dabb family protein [Bacillota bacterium]|nr:Dabb family protein [Bacillota bacterium]
MKHCIIVKWNDKVKDKGEYYKKAVDAFRGVTAIEGVNGYEVYKSNSTRSNRFDIMIEIDCSKEGLENYDVCQLHQDWKKNFTEFFESKTIFDYDR